MQEFAIKNGGHYSSPRIVKCCKTRLDVSFVLDDSCKYSFSDGYSGWNKLTSIRFVTWKKNGLFIAWRYNEKTGLFELVPYANADDANIYPQYVHINIFPNVETKASLFEQAGNLMLVANDDVVRIPIPGVKRTKFSVVGQPYFGGTRPAPHKMSIRLKWL